MNIKSLLIGSAAASMVAVSGAQAADPIIYAEPEPMEYVRICDVYGAGFYYIPGTETCIRISGFVRYQMGATSNADLRRTNPVLNPAAAGRAAAAGPGERWVLHGANSWDGDPLYYLVDRNGTAIVGRPGAVGGGQDVYIGLRAGRRLLGNETPNYHGFTHGGYNRVARGRINFDVRSETEWGTLQGFVRLEGDAPGGVNVPQAYITVTNNPHQFMVGWNESLWVLGGPIGNYGSHSDAGLSYGFQRRGQVRYTFTGDNGFFGAFSAEADDQGTAAPAGATGVVSSYVPDLVAKVGFNQGWGGAYGALAYDRSTTSWAGRVGTDLKLMPGSSLRVAGFYSNNVNNAYAPRMVYRTGVFNEAGALAVTGGARWSAFASYEQEITETFKASIGYQHLRGFFNGARQNTGEVALVWTPIRDFEIRSELGYTQASDNAGSLSGSWSGFLRFQRTF